MSAYMMKHDGLLALAVECARARYDDTRSVGG
jgi:hypothetical protein